MPATTRNSVELSSGRRTVELIDPAALMRIQSLELRAKHVVDGFRTGLHRSPVHGFSVEFTEYRQYVPGDDPRYLDWKLFARSDRYYIKRYEDETNLCCHIALDLSGSMAFGSTGWGKDDYARTLAATLGWFLHEQRDAVGLVLFDAALREMIPARFRTGHRHRLLVALSSPLGGNDTRLSLPLKRLAESLTRRGLVVLISDLLAPLDGWEESLGELRVRGHEVVVLQTLDPAELSFDFPQPAIFVDPETRRERYVDPAAARAKYLERLQSHLDAIHAVCDRQGALYRLIRTDEPLENALFDVIQQRARAGRSAGRSRRSAA